MTPHYTAVTGLSHFFNSKRFSDVTLVLREEQEEQAATEDTSSAAGATSPCVVEAVLPGHAMLLTTLSPYFKAKIDNWSSEPEGTSSSAGAAAKLSIAMPLPSGQLPVGELLVKCIYGAQPDLASIPQVQLVQLLLLADRFEVMSVLVTTAAALKAIPTQSFEWETVHAVYGLPAGATVMPACKDLLAAAAAKVSAELGDLEAAWGSDSKRAMLLGLPHAALVQLLQDAGTRVASENTVAFTVARWYDRQCAELPEGQRPSKEQARELVGLIRMQRCSQGYVGGCFAHEAVAAAALSPTELTQAGPMSGDSALAKAVKLPALKTFPDWDDEARPAAGVTAGSVVLRWILTGKQLKELVQQALDSSGGAANLHSPSRAFMGCPVRLLVSVSGAPNALQFRAAALIDMQQFPEASALVLDYTKSNLSGGVWWKEGSGVSAFTSSSCNWGISYSLGAVDQPAAALQALREQHSLCADNSVMHLRLRVHRVL